MKIYRTPVNSRKEKRPMIRAKTRDLFCHINFINWCKAEEILELEEKIEETSTDAMIIPMSSEEFMNKMK